MGRWAAWLLISILVVTSFCQAAQTNQAEQQALHIPVYLDESNSSGAVVFSVSAGSTPLPVLSSSPMGTSRPLLLIIDPSGYSEPELQKRITALFEAVGAELARSPKVRVGIVAQNGMLFDPPVRNGAFSGNIVSDIMGLIPATEAGTPSDPSHLVDLTAGLLQKAEGDDEPVDCLLIAKDRPFTGEQSEYVRLSAERRMLEVAARKGSVLHGYLEGDGALRAICAATGGMTAGVERHGRFCAACSIRGAGHTFWPCRISRPSGRAGD